MNNWPAAEARFCIEAYDLINTYIRKTSIETFLLCFGQNFWHNVADYWIPSVLSESKSPVMFEVAVPLFLAVATRFSLSGTFISANCMVLEKQAIMAVWAIVFMAASKVIVVGIQKEPILKRSSKKASRCCPLVFGSNNTYNRWPFVLFSYSIFQKNNGSQACFWFWHPKWTKLYYTTLFFGFCRYQHKYME